MTYRFGPYRADRTAYRVFRGDEPLDLTPKLLDLLFYLLDRPATLVTKEELLDGVWPGANVTDNALAQAVSELREAIGDEPASPTFIKTVARRGYRFIAEVTPETTTAATGAGTETAAAPAAAAAASDQPAIIVLDFVNVTGEADVAWLAAGIAETVTSDLAALGHFRVIDRWSVVQAGRGSDGSMQQIGAAFGAAFAVTGSYQRNGARLRITARVVDLRTGASVADAKVDGAIDDVFALQDRIVKTFAHEMGLPASPRARRSIGRETSSLDAYRAYIEGWLKIESLETALVEASIADFERSIQHDAGYALAHTGLANAAFV
ncbi:MAG TPA: winged helix-turn-helix domain-containing protein, partial [Vicinamibacterales bacterium]|nr:winged helix-turn-helix domain-containing protein [Vicinamibacterales bacterium]